ncbi:MAG: hypothetical protein CSB16_03420 [Clostridiales bacterium]|nr:MAG: hypothetical protein CSB16_03420 [Clostridiales bacterium]
MNNLRFEWDVKKNLENIAKHSISFEEAQTVFYDDEAIIIDDPEHSIDEERFILLGFSSLAKFISARKATKNETKAYDEMR